MEGKDDGVIRMVALDAPFGVGDKCFFDNGGQRKIVEGNEVYILCMHVSRNIWNSLFHVFLTRILLKLPCL